MASFVTKKNRAEPLYHLNVLTFIIIVLLLLLILPCIEHSMYISHCARHIHH